MASKGMALPCTILFTTLPWIALPVNVNVAANGYLEVEREDGMRLNMSNESEMIKQSRSRLEIPALAWPFMNQTQPTAGTLVLANVYHLNWEVEKWNIWLHDKYIPGIYHVGIEAFGFEVSFGGGEDERTGLYTQPMEIEDPFTHIVYRYEPKSHPIHVFYQSVIIGYTQLPEDQYIELVNWLAGSKKYQSKEYDVLYNNCISFSEDLIHHLPEHFRLPAWTKFAWTIGWSGGQTYWGGYNFMAAAGFVFKWLMYQGYDVMVGLYHYVMDMKAQRQRMQRQKKQQRRS